MAVRPPGAVVQAVPVRVVPVGVVTFSVVTFSVVTFTVVTFGVAPVGVAPVRAASVRPRPATVLDVDDPAPARLTNTGQRRHPVGQAGPQLGLALGHGGATFPQRRPHVGRHPPHPPAQLVAQLRRHDPVDGLTDPTLGPDRPTDPGQCPQTQPPQTLEHRYRRLAERGRRPAAPRRARQRSAARDEPRRSAMTLINGLARVT
jgi:hypothetical protein